MKICCSDFENFADDIKRKNKKIVMWGIGLIGRIIAPEILSDLDLWNRVECYVDNDAAAWGDEIKVRNKSFAVYPPEHISTYIDDAVLLINISRFSEVIRQADSILRTAEMECFIMPMLLVHNYCLTGSEGDPVFTETAKIPKKLHYMWMGGKTIPAHIQNCMDSWKRYCPDYEIIEWNEHNYDIDKNRYMREAYDAKAYGFVPDYARLDILYNEGGFYLDTDVELIRSLDPLRYQECFCCLEKWQDISFGGFSGSSKGNPTIKRFLDAREEIRFINPDGTQNRNTCGFYDTQTAFELGYRINGKTQNIAGMNVFAYDYFLPYDYMTGQLVKTEHTFSIHWYNGGWMTEEMKKTNENVMKEYEDVYQRALRHG